MWIFWVLVIAGLGLLVSWIVRQNKKSPQGDAGDALEILKKRYARGEINKEEFEQKKKDLLSP